MTAPQGLDTFRLDVEYTRVESALTAGGIRTILLKGPAFDQLLFDGTRARAYSDIDLLVDPAELSRAERLLEGLGFHPPKQRSAPRRLAERALTAARVLAAAHATTWIREHDRFVVDVHTTLPLLRTGAWQALGAHVVTITVVGSPVETLDRAASALLITLHAAHHGPVWSRTRTDLRRGCEVLDRECWRAAARLARDLRAETAMGAGLGTVQEGRALARELGLRTAPTPADRLRWLGVAWTERLRNR